MEDFKKVKFVGTMTNLKGALEDAHNIFGGLIGDPVANLYRPNANKAIILISDGVGNTRLDGKTDWANGNNVNEQLKKIKQFRAVEIYTVAVTNFRNVQQLRDVIATDPSLYMFQPSFEKLKNVAKLIRGGN